MIRKFSAVGLYSFGNTLEKNRLLNTKYEYNFNLSQTDRPMKSAVFFGQNASGKTNLFSCIKILLSIIKYGLSYTKRRYMLETAFNKDSQSATLGIEV